MELDEAAAWAVFNTWVNFESFPTISSKVNLAPSPIHFLTSRVTRWVSLIITTVSPGGMSGWERGLQVTTQFMVVLSRVTSLKFSSRMGRFWVTLLTKWLLSALYPKTAEMLEP